jgi:hypothetical protein
MRRSPWTIDPRGSHLGLEKTCFEPADIDVELACRRLYRDLPDGSGADVDRGSSFDDATDFSVDLAPVLPQSDDDARIEQ